MHGCASCKVLLYLGAAFSSTGSQSANLFALLCIFALQVERRVVMEVLEPECMQAAGLITDIDTWRKKEIRYNTKALYTVNKWV